MNATPKILNCINKYDIATTKNINHAIDGIMIDGEFDGDIRGTTHDVLEDDSYTWEDILECGTLIVPETKTYISDTKVAKLEEIGYLRFPLNDNHIVGFEN